MADANQGAPWGPAPGQLVVVRWSDGVEYPGQVVTVQGNQILCRFPNGNDSWVPAVYVRSAEPPAAAQGPALANPASPNAPRARSTKKAPAALLLGLAAAFLVTLLVFATIAIRGKGAWPLSMLFPEAAFVAHVEDASEAIVAAALGKPYDEKWNGTVPKDDLRGTDPLRQKELLDADVKVGGVVVVVGAIRPTPSGHDSLSGEALIVDGQLRWSRVLRSANDFPPFESRRGFDTAKPAMAYAGRHLLEVVNGDCSLPLLTPADVRTLPEGARAQLLRSLKEVPEACSKGSASGDWQPHVKAIVVLAEANGSWFALQSSVDVEKGRVRLGPVGAKLIKTETEVAAAPAVSAAPPAPPSAGAVSVGAQVTVPTGDGKSTSVTVEALYGKLVKYRHKGGALNWEYLSKTTPAGTPLPDPVGHACSVLVGQRVKVRWPYDNKKYLVRVGEVYGRMARVVHADGGELQWVRCEDANPVF